MSKNFFGATASIVLTVGIFAIAELPARANNAASDSPIEHRPIEHCVRGCPGCPGRYRQSVDG